MERIVSHEKDRESGEYIYVVKWKDYGSGNNTKEPEAHLVTCSILLAYWKGKKKSKPHTEHVMRVTKLQEVALRERHHAETRRRTRPVQSEPTQPTTPSSAAGSAPTPASRPMGVPEDCRTAYDCGHGALTDAHCLILDTETSGFSGSVLNLGWILATADGSTLVTYDRL